MNEFPVLGTQETVPWNVICQHEKQAMSNHGQSLKRLAERGGLDYSEILAILEDRPYKKMELYYCRMMVLRIIAELN